MRNAEQAIGRYRLGFAFERKRADRIDPRIALSQQPGCFADQDRSRLGCRLESRSDIRRVTDHRRIHRQSVANRAEDHCSGVDPDPHRELQSLAIGRFTIPTECSLDAERRQQGAPHVVFVCPRGAEDRQETVAGELRHSPIVAPHLGDRNFEKAVDEIAHLLGAEPLGQGGRADDVAEQHADLLHLAHMRGRRGQAGQGCGFGETRGVGAERCSAVSAKSVFGRVGGAAGRAGDTERRRALSAEPCSGGILGVAPRTSHAGPPKCAEMLRRRES